MGTQLPLPQKGAEPPIFVPCLLWPNGWNAGWIKMALGTEVGLASDVLLDGDPAPPKGARPSVFGPCLLWPYGWIDEDATWY